MDLRIASSGLRARPGTAKGTMVAFTLRMRSKKHVRESVTRDVTFLDPLKGRGPSRRAVDLPESRNSSQEVTS